MQPRWKYFQIQGSRTFVRSEALTCWIGQVLAGDININTSIAVTIAQRILCIACVCQMSVGPTLCILR